MFIVVQHEIHNPDGFWSHGKTMLEKIPTHLKSHLGLPTTDPKVMFCLWEAKSTEALKSFLEGHVGEPYAKNHYFEVAAEKAMGLPASAALVG